MAWVIGAVGEAWVHAHEARHRALPLWRIQAGGHLYWLKTQPDTGRYRREREAYSSLSGHLIRTGHHIARVVAASDAHRAMLLSHLPGAPATTLAPSDPRWPQIWRSAGSWLRALHETPCTSPDPLPLAQALRARATALLKRSHGRVDPALLQRFGDQISDLSLAQTDQRVWCHRDFGPDNWLVDERGEVAVVDFEHSRPDHWLTDLANDHALSWLDHPEAMAWFFQGYGRSLKPREAALLSVLRWMSALRTVSWADDHGDPAFERAGHRVLAHLASAASDG